MRASRVESRERRQTSLAHARGQDSDLGSRVVGGAGLVLTEMTDVLAEGRISLHCAGMYSPEHVPAWELMLQLVQGALDNDPPSSVGSHRPVAAPSDIQPQPRRDVSRYRA